MNPTNDPPAPDREYTVDGIRVEHGAPGDPHPTPLVLVHGGFFGSDTWHGMMAVFAEAGWDCHALNWRGGHGSATVSDAETSRRSLVDVADDIAAVADQFDRPPVVVAHSMGAISAQKWAEHHPHSGLVLINPVVPSEVGADPIDIPAEPGRPFGPLPFEISGEMFFQGLSETEARAFYERFEPISPVMVEEATRWTLSVDATRISGPVLVVAGEIDRLCPPVTARALATLYGADYRFVLGQGHSLPFGPVARQAATVITDWLDANVMGRP